jgi:hypothetical protein
MALGQPDCQEVVISLCLSVEIKILTLRRRGSIWVYNPFFLYIPLDCPYCTVREQLAVKMRWYN